MARDARGLREDWGAARRGETRDDVGNRYSAGARQEQNYGFEDDAHYDVFGRRVDEDMPDSRGDVSG